MGEVCAAAAEVGDALDRLIETPGEVEECQKHLSSAIWHLAEALKARRHETTEAEQSMVVEDLQRKVLRLNKLYRHSQAFYKGWASLAGVDESDAPRGCHLFHG